MNSRHSLIWTSRGRSLPASWAFFKKSTSAPAESPNASSAFSNLKTFFSASATAADTDFGQTDFGHPYLADFGQADFGPNWCFSLLAFFFKKKQNNQMKKIQTPLRSPEGWGPQVELEGAKVCGGGGRGGRGKISRFFPSPAPTSFFFCLSGCLLVEFWWCF